MTNWKQEDRKYVAESSGGRKVRHFARSVNKSKCWQRETDLVTSWRPLLEENITVSAENPNFTPFSNQFDTIWSDSPPLHHFFCAVRKHCAKLQARSQISLRQLWWESLSVCLSVCMHSGFLLLWMRCVSAVHCVYRLLGFFFFK